MTGVVTGIVFDEAGRGAAELEVAADRDGGRPGRIDAECHAIIWGDFDGLDGIGASPWRWLRTGHGEGCEGPQGEYGERCARALHGGSLSIRRTMLRSQCY